MPANPSALISFNREVDNHLKTLERAGLVRRTVQGRTHICRLTPEHPADVQAWLRFYERFWNERLGALEALLRPETKGVRDDRATDGE